MVKVITKFKKGKSQGGLSGKTDVSTFRTVAEAKKYKSFLKGTYVSSEIVARKTKKRTSGFGYSMF